MSHALLETWKRREANTLTVEGYTASGGIRGAVAKSAEAVYAGIGPEQRVVLRDLVLRLVSSGTQGEPVRARLPRRLFSAEPDHQQLIDLLVGSRLVTSDAGVVEIAHEALARAWPRLRTWLDEDMEGQRIRQHLTSAADGWDTLGRPDSELYRGVRLTQALQWRERADTRLTATEIAFLDAVRAREQSERRAEQVRAQAQARLIRRLRGGPRRRRRPPRGRRWRRPDGLRAAGPGRGQRRRRDRGGDQRRGPPRAGAGADHRRHGRVDAARGRRRPAGRLTRDPEQPAVRPGPAPGADRVHGAVRRGGALLRRQPGRTHRRDLRQRPTGSGCTTCDRCTAGASSRRRSGPPRTGCPARCRFSPDGSILAVDQAAPTRQPVALLDATTLEPLPAQPGGTRGRGGSSTGSTSATTVAGSQPSCGGSAVNDDTTRASEQTGSIVWDLRRPRPAGRLEARGLRRCRGRPDGGRTDALFTTQPADPP